MLTGIFVVIFRLMAHRYLLEMRSDVRGCHFSRPCWLSEVDTPDNMHLRIRIHSIPNIPQPAQMLVNGTLTALSQYTIRLPCGPAVRFFDTVNTSVLDIQVHEPEDCHEVTLPDDAWFIVARRRGRW